MNRPALGMLLIVAVVLSACSFGAAQPDAAAQATSKAFVGTAGAQTLAVLPTLTNPPTNTAPPTQPATATQQPTDTAAPPSNTPSASATSGTSTNTGTATATGTPSTPSATATGASATLPSPTSTVTGTPPTATKTVTGTPPTATATDLMVTRVYGTQPPYVDYGRIELRNQSKTQVYISFQCTTPEGYYVIVEYPVGGSYFKVSVPAGRCAYVAWIGGQEFTGEFGLKPFEELTFTFKKSGITIQ